MASSWLTYSWRWTHHR